MGRLKIRPYEDLKKDGMYEVDADNPEITYQTVLGNEESGASMDTPKQAAKRFIPGMSKSPACFMRKSCGPPTRTPGF